MNYLYLNVFKSGTIYLEYNLKLAIFYEINMMCMEFNLPKT